MCFWRRRAESAAEFAKMFHVELFLILIACLECVFGADSLRIRVDLLKVPRGIFNLDFHGSLVSLSGH